MLFVSGLFLAALLPLFDLALKIAALITLAAVAATLARRAAAATRHLLYLCALIASLALPLVGWLIPPTVGARWQVSMRDSAHPPVASPTTSAAANPPATTDETTGTADSAPPSHLVAALPTITANATAAARKYVFPPVSLLRVVYAMGATFVLLQVVLGALAVRRLARSSQPADTHGAAATALNTALAEVGGIRSDAVRLRLASEATPLTWGWRHPTILLPTDAADTWEPERLYVVLLHELAHIARRDWPIQMLVHAICAAYWFHPLVWWAASRLRAESERACDDRVLLAGVPSDAYAAHLLAIATHSRQHRLTREGIADATALLDIKEFAQ